MNKKAVLISFLLTVGHMLAFTQNLVINPSFEIKNRSAGKGFDLSNQKFHRSRGHVFHFMRYAECGPLRPIQFKRRIEEEGCSVPCNFVGSQQAHSGIGYLSLGGPAHYIKDIEESNDRLLFIPTASVIGNLSESLQKDVVYYAEFYVSLCDFYSNTTDKFWMVFSDSILWQDSFIYDYETLPKQIQSTSGVYYADKKNWQKVSGTFVAKGGEKVFCLGFSAPDNFVPSNKLRENDMFYYIDDILVREVKDTLIIEKEKPLILKNVVFESGKADLLPESFPELDKVADYLKVNAEMRVQVSGHTDNKGDKAENMLLSEARSKSVAAYLIKSGITTERIEHKGYGDTKPIADNTTDEGRAQNRRVEIKLL